MCSRTFFRLGVYVFVSAAIILTPAHRLNAQQNDNELFLVAQKAFEDGFYDVATRYINQLLKEYPQTDKRLQANLLLGQCYFFNSQYLKAYDVFQSLLQYNEFKDATLFWLGETYLKGADYKQAKSYYQQLIETYPDSVYTPQALYSMGWVHFEQGKFEDARKTFSRFLTKFPTHQLSEDAMFKRAESVYNMGNYQEAIGLFGDYIKRSPQSTRHGESYFYMGESYYYLEDFLTANTFYAKAADVSYDNKLVVMAKVSLGWSYLKLNKLDLAEKHFNEALELSKGRRLAADDIYLGRASLYTQRNEYEKAIEAYTQLIEEFPNSQRQTEAYLGVANSYYLLKDYPRAIKTYQVMLAKFSKDARQTTIIEKAYFGLAWAYLKAGDIDNAVGTFQTIRDQTKSNVIKVSALSQIGDAYQDVNELQKAVNIYDKILKEYAESPYTDYVQYRQGIALLKMGKIEAATLSFQSLQANFPQSKYLGDIKYYLAVAYFKKNDWGAAKKQISEFIGNEAGSNEFLAEAHYILGLANFHLSDYSEAQKIFQKIIKSFTEQKTIVRNSEVYLAKCAYNLGNTKEALKEFELILSNNPNSEAAEESLIWIAEYYLQSSQLKKTVDYYEQYLKQFPQGERVNAVRFDLGQVFKSLGEHDRAVQVLKQVTEEDRAIFAKASLAIAEIFAMDVSPESAIETYQNILVTSPEFKRDAYLKIADVYRARNEQAKAVETYQKALKAEKGLSQVQNAELQFLTGDAYEVLNKPDEAVEAYLKIPYLYAANVPWVVKAYLRIARIFEDQEQWEQASLTYEKVLALKTEESRFAQERLEWIQNNIVGLNK